MTDLNRALFYDIVSSADRRKHERYNIGTYKEKELHIIMKKYFETDESFHEVKTNGFIADIRREDLITEIETSGFSGLRPKLAAYLPEYRVRLVYPLAAKKYVAWIDTESAEISPRKKSPKKEGIYDLLYEMIYVLPFVNDKRLTFVAPLLEIDEYRLLNGWSRDKKRGSTRYERIPTDIIDIIELHDNDSYLAAIPDELRYGFTTPEFANATKQRSRRAYAIVKVLLERGIIANDGKKGRAAYYKIAL